MTVAFIVACIGYNIVHWTEKCGASARLRPAGLNPLLALMRHITAAASRLFKLNCNAMPLENQKGVLYFSENARGAGVGARELKNACGAGIGATALNAPAQPSLEKLHRPPPQPSPQPLERGR